MDRRSLRQQEHPPAIGNSERIIEVRPDLTWVFLGCVRYTHSPLEIRGESVLTGQVGVHYPVVPSPALQIVHPLLYFRPLDLTFTVTGQFV
jgi:hypothetical protein